MKKPSAENGTDRRSDGGPDCIKLFVPKTSACYTANTVVFESLLCLGDTSNRNNGHRDTCAHDTSVIQSCVGGYSGGYDDVTMTFLYGAGDPT